MSNNIVWHTHHVTKQERSQIKSQKPCILWFTGLSGSGKSTIANAVENRLHAEGLHTYLLDGDNVRHGLNKDLGFSDEDRVENIRRIGEVAKLFVDSGLIVLTAFISPFRSDRALVRDLVDEGGFSKSSSIRRWKCANPGTPRGFIKKRDAVRSPILRGSAHLMKRRFHRRFT